MSSMEAMKPTSLIRRRLLLASAAVATAPLWGCRGGGSAKAATVVSMTSGKFIGQPDGTTLRYHSIPYAEPPVGPLRTRSPQPYVPATADAVRASSFGPASIQTFNSSVVSWIYPTITQQKRGQSDAQRMDAATRREGACARLGARRRPAKWRHRHAAFQRRGPSGAGRGCRHRELPSECTGLALPSKPCRCGHGYVLQPGAAGHARIGRRVAQYQHGMATCVRWGEAGAPVEAIGPVPKSSQLVVWDDILGY
ncbi:carboxylesterase family protein [Paraburkholderia sp. UCT2]|nr:carboxylesterase family protein [Paraburkholderia sp. UCT2]